MQSRNQKNTGLRKNRKKKKTRGKRKKKKKKKKQGEKKKKGKREKKGKEGKHGRIGNEKEAWVSVNRHVKSILPISLKTTFYSTLTFQASRKFRIAGFSRNLKFSRIPFPCILRRPIAR